MEKCNQDLCQRPDIIIKLRMKGEISDGLDLYKNGLK
jgi:hypothetical protein